MFNTPAFIYLATVLPPIFLGLIIWKSDKFPEPGKFLVTAFLLGVSIFLPLDFLILIAENHIGPMLGLNMTDYNLYQRGENDEGFTIGAHAFMHFFRAAFLEEGLKFALLIFICVKLEALDEPIDAIVYGASIGLGYAAMENLFYLYAPDAWSLETVTMRYYPLIMHLGSLINAGFSNKKNYKHILLNNGSHESVGGQKINTAKINFKKTVKSFGFKNFYFVTNKKSYFRHLRSFLKSNGPSFMQVQIKSKSLKNLSRPKNLIKIKENFLN